MIDLFAGSPLVASLIGIGMLLPLAAIAHVVLAAPPRRHCYTLVWEYWRRC